MTRCWKVTVALPLLALALAACGGRVEPTDDVPLSPDSGSAPTSTASGGSLTGSFHGQAVDVHDVVAIRSTETLSGPEFVSQLLISFTDAPDLCTDLANGMEPSSTRYLNVILIQRSTSQMPVIAPGTYAASTEEQHLPGGDTLFASGGYVALDDRCINQEINGNVASAGSITIASITDTGVTGSFAVTFPGGDRFTGTFNAPSCGAAAALPKTSPGCR